MVTRRRGRRGSLVQSPSWDSPASLNLLGNQEEEGEEDEDDEDDDDDDDDEDKDKDEDEDEDKDEDKDEDEDEDEGEGERDHDPNRSSFWTRSRPSSWASSITTFHLRK